LFFNPLVYPYTVRSVFLNAGPIVHFEGNAASHENCIISAGKGIVVKNNVIECVQDSQELVDEYSIHPGQTNPEVKVHDLAGAAVTPGLIDAHTHLLWAGDRSDEVRLRREGLSYSEIAQGGGGIQSTVRSTRNASSQSLFKSGYVRLREALKTGTTHLEAKSGYGLDTTTELQLLEVMKSLSDIGHVPTVDPTWMGAHDVPKGSTIEAYVDELVSEQLPAVLEQGIARSADVFCEPGWFDVDSSERILKEARSGGLSLRMHVDEFEDGGGGELAASLGVVTADHAYCTPIESRRNMRDAGVMTGFLPGTPYAMGDAWPDMDAVHAEKIPYTLASDFNPNCQTLSLPFMMSLMVQRCGVHPLEALRAVTANAALSTPHPSGFDHGQIKEGAVANLNILQSPHWESMCLRPTGSPVAATVLNGDFISQ
jgi:imidazolonepropionase